MKKLAYILLCFLFSSSLSAQNYLTNALHSLKNQEFDKATELIDAAMADSMFVGKAATWYYAGNIYKEQYKKQELKDKQSPLRNSAASFFIKSIELDTAGTYQKSSRQNLKFLSQTIFNDAVKSFNTKEYPIAISNYEQYKSLLSLAYPETEFAEKDIMFNLALATTYSKIADLDTINRAIFLKKAEDLYYQVIDIDSNNVSANYNVGIIYYNQGVDIVNNMDYSLDLEQLNQVQERIIELFRKSLPYMKKAYDLDPKRKETLIGLQGIYFSLNDIPKSEAFKKELESLEKEQSIKEGPAEDVELQEE